MAVIEVIESLLLTQSVLHTFYSIQDEYWTV